jgi:hypothetical protein
MQESADAQKPLSASVSLGNEVGKIERLPIGVDGQEQIRFSVWSQDKMLPRPLSLTEKELVVLVKAAFKEGVLSQQFIGELRSVTEI